MTNALLPQRIRLKDKGNQSVAVLYDQTTHGFVSHSVSPPRDAFWNNPDSKSPTEKLMIVRLESPARFWLQNVKDKEKLDALVKEMTEWYNEYWENSAPLKQCEVVLGGFYAAYSDQYEEWYRVRVTNTVVIEEKDPDYIVQLLDFGSITAVALDSICPLREIYNKLPIQAVQGKLYDESPSPGCFTSAQYAKFVSDVGGKVFDMIVVEEQQRVDEVFQIIHLIIVTKSISPYAAPDTFFNNFYTLDGRFKFDLLYAQLKKLTGGITMRE